MIHVAVFGWAVGIIKATDFDVQDQKVLTEYYKWGLFDDIGTFRDLYVRIFVMRGVKEIFINFS